ncbi:MAG TPA: DUF1015 domain-containing protein [Vicinamibacteria bacterium]
MAEIQPFPGVLYRVPDAELPRVLAPPYDVISPAQQEGLYARDPRNIVRVVLNREDEQKRYDSAGATYRGWLAAGVLAPDDQPALYLLEQVFSVEDRSFSRRGLLARFRAEDPDRGSILPHEHTRKAPREDRFRLLKATRANFSPIFLMFPDAERRFRKAFEQGASGPPDRIYTDDGGVVHRLWRVTAPDAIAELQATLRAPRAYIADGHHRYATALRYRDEVGPMGAWTLGYFTPLDDPGLVVLPYHRVLERSPPLAEARGALRGAFLVTDAGSAAAAARQAGQSTMPYAFGLADRQGALVVESLPEAQDLLPREAPASLRVLDTFFLHQAVLPRVLRIGDEAVDYVHSFAEAEAAVGEGKMAVLMRSTPVRQIVDVAEARESMPAKSTFFHPKLPSGLVIHPLP